MEPFLKISYICVSGVSPTEGPTVEPRKSFVSYFLSSDCFLDFRGDSPRVRMVRDLRLANVHGRGRQVVEQTTRNDLLSWRTKGGFEAGISGGFIAFSKIQCYYSVDVELLIDFEMQTLGGVSASCVVPKKTQVNEKSIAFIKVYAINLTWSNSASR